ncbi:glycoside hydrolase family 95 protein [Candidatus Poribacteria bacterium]|nr:glycoside hydrolase family 95 protein [Candidatus Poribacteria bacterium]
MEVKMSNKKHRMIMRSPATRWQDASATGNGSVGAMMYGQIRTDVILINHEALYYPRDHRKLLDVSDKLPELRNLIDQGKYQEAAKLMPRVHAERGGMQEGSTSDYTDPYQPFCDISLRTSTDGPFSKYCRGVDFETGRVWTEWSDNTGHLTRDLFVSRANDTIFMRIKGDKPGMVSHALRICQYDASGQHEGVFTSKGLKPAEYSTNAEDNGFLVFTGRYQDKYDFGAVGKVTIINGKMRSDRGEIVVEGADEVLMKVKLFIRENPEEAVPGLKEELETDETNFDEALAKHTALHGEIFNRMKLNLCEPSDMTNEELLLASYGEEIPTALIQNIFDYGRYLLICSSSSSGWPANLQGIWNGDYMPAWNSDFHTDENIQMNYWQALPGNMADLTLCYFDYFERYLNDYRDNARKLYGARGILVPIAQTTHGIAFPTIWTNWISAAGWLGQLFYDYFLFTGDRDFLAKRAVPWLKETALFYEDYLYEGEDGKMIFSPSLSPENVPSGQGMGLLTINATMDVAVCREVLNNLCEACELLNIEQDGVSRWRGILSKLPEYEVNEDGAIREWLYPGFKDNYHHRHQSHIYPIFPGLEVTEETNPEIYEACKIAVEKRLVIGLTSQSGWSTAHMANIYARLGDGNRALECLEILSKSSTGPNLFTYHNDWRNMGLSLYSKNPPFQIDANFGMAAAIIEMLVFSKPGIIKLLPAVPDKWNSGSIKGVACRGGVLVDMEWNFYKGFVKAGFISKRDQDILVKLPGKIKQTTVIPSETKIVKSDLGDSYIFIKINQNKKVNIDFEIE